MRMDSFRFSINEAGGGDNHSLSRLDEIIKEKEKEEDLQCEDKVEVCKSILRHENRGATHFISSIDLGAKVYRTKKVVVSQTASKLSVIAGAVALIALPG